MYRDPNNLRHAHREGDAALNRDLGSGDDDSPGARPHCGEGDSAKNLSVGFLSPPPEMFGLTMLMSPAGHPAAS